MKLQCLKIAIYSFIIFDGLSDVNMTLYVCVATLTKGLMGYKFQRKSNVRFDQHPSPRNNGQFNNSPAF